MKALGVVRNIDQLGRLVIPKEVRKTQGWDANTPMEMFMDGNKLVVQEYRKDEENELMIKQLETAAKLSDNEAVKEIMKNAIKFLKKA